MTRPRQRIGVQLTLLLAAVLLEVVFFPQLVATLMHLGGKPGGPGSEVIAFRDLYVLPGAVVFLLAAAGVIVSSDGRRLIVTATWVANVVAVVVSIFVYRGMVGRWD